MGEKRQWTLTGPRHDFCQADTFVAEGPKLEQGERVVVAPVEDLEARCEKLAEGLVAVSTWLESLQADTHEQLYDHAYRARKAALDYHDQYAREVLGSPVRPPKGN